MNSTRTMAAAMLAGSLAACAHDAAAPVSTGTITTQQATEVGGRLSREIGSSFAALTLGPRGGLAAAIARTGGGTAPATADVVPCPVVTGGSDADGDGVPDHAILTFTQPACRGETGGDTVEITGVVELSDPVFSPPPSPAAFGFAASMTDFTVRFIAADSDSSFVETRNGAEELLFTAGGLGQTHAFSIQHSDAHGHAAIVDQWTMNFTPALGTSLVLGAPLPAGTYAVAGATSWQTDSSAAAFELVTAVPLAYDPTCPANSANQFRSGEIHAALGGPGGHASIRIVFADCNPSVSIVAQGG